MASSSFIQHIDWVLNVNNIYNKPQAELGFFSLDTHAIRSHRLFHTPKYDLTQYEIRWLCLHRQRDPFMERQPHSFPTTSFGAF